MDMKKTATEIVEVIGGKGKNAQIKLIETNLKIAHELGKLDGLKKAQDITNDVFKSTFK